MTLKDFIVKAAEDCVNGSSVSLLDRRETDPEGIAALAAGLRLRAQDAAEGREGWNGKLGGKPCMSCGRTSLYLEDGWCPQCNTSSPEELAERWERDRPRREAVSREEARKTAAYMRRVGFPDEAEYWERKAEGR